MSALGQKQTYAVQNGMSALPPIATAKADTHKVMSALPPKADMCGATRDVRFGPEADIGQLFDHLVGAGEHAYWNDETKLIRGLAVDD